MKYFMIGLLVAAGSFSAFAGGGDILLKSELSVFYTGDGPDAPPPFFRTCDFYDNQVIITEKGGADPAPQRISRTPYSESELRSLSRSAKNDRIVRRSQVECDAGSVVITAYPTTNSSIIIRNIEDCGSGTYFRTGAASRKLRAITERYCKTGL